MLNFLTGHSIDTYWTKILDQFIVNLNKLNIHDGNQGTRSTEMKKILMGTKRLCYSHKGSQLLAENGTNYTHVEFSDYCVCYSFKCFCHRKLIYAALSVLNEITKLMLPTCAWYHKNSLVHCKPHLPTLRKDHQGNYDCQPELL